MIHTVKGFGMVHEAEADFLLEFPFFLHNPTIEGNLISGCSASLKLRLYI